MSASSRGDDKVYAGPMNPRVFNIPASAPFLTVLIDALLNDGLGLGFPASRDPLELARATLYLPTRRACRLARDVFLDRLDGDAAILPRIWGYLKRSLAHPALVGLSAWYRINVPPLKI